MRSFIFYLSFILFVAGITSCSSVEYQEDFTGISSSGITAPILDKDSAFICFAEILSKAVYERKDVREFIKQEASKKFDANTDILYGEVKNQEINGTTFREILIGYSSLEILECIEKTVPRLNIYVPEFSIFGINVNNMDCNDVEIPVAIAAANGMKLYVNGIFDTVIPKGELPAFHTIVINENKRVSVNTNPTRSYCGYTFLGINIADSVCSTRSQTTIDQKIKDAYSYFYKDDGSINSRALQRDYIYYGITPDNQEGHLNQSVNEYIYYIEVDPNAYAQMTDEIGEEIWNDPNIIKSEVVKKGSDFTEDELISNMWSQGSYSFRFEITTSTSSHPTAIILNLRPEQLWDFNYDKEYTHSTWFRHSKYTYKIDYRKFTAKKHYLDSYNISFGKWDLSNEALERYIDIYEVDHAQTYTSTYTYEMNVVTSEKVNGTIKIGLGTGSSGEVGTELNNTTTKKVQKTFTVERTEKDDYLGSTKIYFYDPIILKVWRDRYINKKYNTGVVSFGILAK